MLNSCEFYITNYKNNTAILPVAPSDVKIRAETSDSVSTVIGLGEINRVGDQKIKDVKISGILPNKAQNLPYVTSKPHWIYAESYITFLRNIQKSGHHCHLVITGTDISIPMTISAFEYGRENLSEYTYTIELKEYKEIKARKLRARTKKHPKRGKARPKPAHKLSRGSKVTVNGLAYLSKNATRGVQIRRRHCRITLVSRHAKHPYYCRSLDGYNMGWVSRKALIK